MTVYLVVENDGPTHAVFSSEDKAKEYVSKQDHKEWYYIQREEVR